MSRSLRVKKVFKSRILWRIYAALAVVLLVATSAMSVVFLWRLKQAQSLDEEVIVRALVSANIVGVFFALVFGLWISRSVRAGLEEITQVAQSLTYGDFTARVRRPRKDEFGLLAQTLNILGEELTDRMAALSRERAQLQAMLAGMVEGIVAVSDNNRVLFSNRAADNVLKVDIAAARGRYINEVTGLGILLPNIIEAKNSSHRVQKELTILDDGELRTLEITSAKFKGDVDGGVVIVIHDVTELRRLERVRRDFVANVSHELKTPLTSVKGYVETLQSGAKSDPVILDRFLAKIETNVVRLANLVQDILSLAAADRSDGRIGNEKIDWMEVGNQVLIRHDHEIKRKQLKVNLNCDSTSALVFGDHESLTQIVDNLLSNAIKYSPDSGSILLNIKKIANEVVFEVKDSGVGIPEEHLPRIFERFYRVDKARSRELGGTGLGLSIVKHLVSAMNGRIVVESQVGVGSTFSVMLQSANATQSST